MLMSQFSAVESPLTFADSGARTPTRLAIGAMSRAIAGQSTTPNRVFFGRPSMMFSSTVMPGTNASSWWMKLMPSSFARCGRADGDAPPVNDDLSAVGLRQTREDPDQGRFSCAVRPDKAVNLAGKDRQRHPSQRRAPPKALLMAFTETRGDAAGVPGCGASSMALAPGFTSPRTDDRPGTSRYSPWSPGSPAPRSLLAASSRRP